MISVFAHYKIPNRKKTCQLIYVINVPDISQENDETGIDELLVELREHAIGDEDAAQDEEGVDEKIAMEKEPSGSTSVFLVKEQMLITLKQKSLTNN